MKITIIPNQITSVISSIGSLYNIIKRNQENLMGTHPLLKELVLEVKYSKMPMRLRRKPVKYTISADRSVIAITLDFFLEPSAEQLNHDITKQLEELGYLSLYKESIAS